MEKKKKQKNKCNELCREAEKDHFNNITESNLNSNNKFWQFVKPFLTIKEVFGTDFISTKKDNQLIDNKVELVEMFNSHRINTLENMTGFNISLQILSPFMICKKLAIIV